MQKNTFIGFFIVLLIGGIVGYAGASYQYSTVLDKARSAFPTPPTMSIITGTITEIADNAITIRTFPAANPFETLPEVRKVTVTGDTKIVKSMPKDPKVFQREMEEYQEALQDAAPLAASSTAPVTMTPPTPPLPFRESTLEVADLKVGDMVMVDAGQDVKTSTSFDAIKISVTGASPVGAPPIGAPAGAAPVVNAAPPPAGGAAPIITTPAAR